MLTPQHLKSQADFYLQWPQYLVVRLVSGVKMYFVAVDLQGATALEGTASPVY